MKEGGWVKMNPQKKIPSKSTALLGLSTKKRSQDGVLKELMSGVFYRYQCGLCNESCFGECVRHLNVRIKEHIGNTLFES